MTGAGEPGLRIRSGHGPVTGVVLVLGGGRADSLARGSRRHLSYQRMRPFARTAARAAGPRGVAVWRLRYRVRGWNGDARDPVRDAFWALELAATRHPGAPVVLVGHSMGGRTALHAAGAPAVVAVCALAPWIEPGDPVDQLAGKLVVIAHGDRDRVTDPANSRRYATDAARAGATVAHFEVAGESHALLRRAADWHTLVRDTVASAFGFPDPRAQLATVLDDPPERRLGVALAGAGR